MSIKRSVWMDKLESLNLGFFEESKGGLVKVLEEWESGLATMKKGERLYIVSGEACWVIYEVLEEMLSQLDNVRMIAGPVIFVNPANGNNAIFRLAAKKDTFHLFPAKHRMYIHFKAFHLHKLQWEGNYEPIAPFPRHFEEIIDPYRIGKFIYDFEQEIKIFDLKQYEGENGFVRATPEIIRKMKEVADKEDKNYDFLGAKDLLQLKADLEKSQLESAHI